MKKIFIRLQQIESKGYYYRMVANPNTIDIKLYLNTDESSPEVNFLVDNTDDGRYSMYIYLYDFLIKL